MQSCFGQVLEEEAGFGKVEASERDEEMVPSEEKTDRLRSEASKGSGWGLYFTQYNTWR